MSSLLLAQFASALRPTAFAVCLAISTGWAGAQTPSPASLERLLEVTQAERLTDSVVQQVHAQMKPMMSQALSAKEMTPAQRAQADRFMDRFVERMNDILKDELAWSRMKDFNLQIYRDTFNQQEVDDLIRFYESPTGQAFVNKMPQVLARSMALMQQRMLPISERIRAAAQETVEEFKREQAAQPSAIVPPAPGPTRARAAREGAAAAGS